MLTTTVIAQLAAELHASEKSRVQVEHFSKRFPEMTVSGGYAISREWVKTKIAEGRVVKGHKIGLTVTSATRRIRMSGPPSRTRFAASSRPARQRAS